MSEKAKQFVELSARKKEEYVLLAQKEVDEAIQLGNPPFGAVLIAPDGSVVVTAHNTQHSDCDPTAHSEINLLRKAAQRLKTIYFDGYAIVGNAEPCSMCSSACIKAKIRQFIFGAWHEESMDPNVDIQTVAQASKEPVLFEGGILQSQCIEQIVRGRLLAKR